jgi:hypothetical protein
MEIFGTSLSSETLWLLGVVGAGVTLLATHRLSASREKTKRLAEATAAFRQAFADAILNLERYVEVTSGQVAYEFRVQHLAAIERYVPFLPWYKQPFFRRAARIYGEASEHCAPKGQVLAVFASEQTQVAEANRRMLLRAIQRLLSYAKQI